MCKPSSCQSHISGNRTLNNATNGVSRSICKLVSNSRWYRFRTLSFASNYEFGSDTAPTLTTTASLGDFFVFYYNGSKFVEVGRNLALTLS